MCNTYYIFYTSDVMHYFPNIALSSEKKNQKSNVKQIKKTYNYLKGYSFKLNHNQRKMRRLIIFR